MGATLPAQRFTDNGDGTLTDTLTGLVWLKNAHCAETLAGIVVTYVGYPVDPNVFGFPWQNALTWVTGLSNGHCGLTDGSQPGNWRLPNNNELASLVSKSDVPVNTWLANQGFTRVDTNFGYWTSTTFTQGPGGAYIQDLRTGNNIGPGKTTIRTVLPVRDPR